MCHTYDVTIKNGDDGDPVRSSELKLYGLTRASIKTVSAVLGTAVETAGLPSYPRRGFSSCLLGTQPMEIPGWVHLENDPHVSQPTKTSLLDSHEINDPFMCSIIPTISCIYRTTVTPKTFSENSQFNQFTI